MFHFESKGRRKLTSQLEGRQKKFPYSDFVLFRPSIDWMRSSHIGRAVCFIQSTYSVFTSLRNTLTDTPRIEFDQISGQSSWHIKLTIVYTESEFWVGTSSLFWHFPGDSDVHQNEWAFWLLRSVLGVMGNAFWRTHNLVGWVIDPGK